MADPLPNGTPTASRDVEMSEGIAAETVMHHDLPPDPTDPNPPPQAVPAQQQLAPSESVAAIQPMAAPTPPAIAAASARPSSMPPQPSARPEKPVAHGGPTRQFLNQNVTPHLLEGMKYLAVYEPEKPLLWLSDFLRDRSKEVED